MILKPLEYFAPTSLQEACEILDEHDGAKILAGGQSLLPIMKLDLTEVTHLVDIKKIPNLSFIKIEDDESVKEDYLIIGALTTHAEVGNSDVVKKNVPLLADTALTIGHPLIRNRGTVGGSISHCDPAGDFCVSSLALDAKMVLVRSDGSRRVADSKSFFHGPFETDMKRGEILEKILFPIPPENTYHAYDKLTQGHGDFPLVVVSTLLQMENKRCTDARIALGGVAEKAIRIARSEELLRNKNVQLEEIDRAASIAEEESRPEADIDVSAGYKKRMVKVLVRRALRTALSRSGMKA
ncbi:MAG: FAD binding domain-containing protein [Rhabdochlamydiaceae bacterium]